jgi:hypothetical protein
VIRLRAVVAILAALAIASCGRADPRGGPYPAACAGFQFSERQCSAIITRALELTGLPRVEASAFELLPPHRQQGASLGRGPMVTVRIHRADGDVLDQEIACIGVRSDPTCAGDQARIMLLRGVEQGLPCTGIDPDRTPVPPGVPSDPIQAGCPSPPPTPPPGMVAQATPLRIDRKVISIDHAGHYDIPLGTATLPDGYPSEISFDVGDDQPTAYWIDALGLTVSSDIPGRPPVEYLSRAFEPYDGLEPVTVSMHFDVTLYVEPSTLILEDIVVR